jgi:hypothetical protein
VITWARGRRALPYLGAGLGGFVIAWALVAFVVFPSGTPPQDARVPNVIGLPFDEAVQRLEQAGFKADRGCKPRLRASPSSSRRRRREVSSSSEAPLRSI